MGYGEIMKINNKSKLKKSNKEENPKENKKMINFKDLMNMDLGKLKTEVSKKLKKINRLGQIEKKKKVIAFDMGSSTIKIVEGMYYKNNLTIDKYIKIQTPKDVIKDGEIKKEEELYSKLNQVLKENAIKLSMQYSQLILH